MIALVPVGICVGLVGMLVWIAAISLGRAPLLECVGVALTITGLAGILVGVRK